VRGSQKVEETAADSLVFLYFPFQPHSCFCLYRRSLAPVTVRRTALLGWSQVTVTKVVLLNSDQLGPQLVGHFGWMRITRSLIRFVRPYDDGVGLNTLAESVVTEQSL
jgi:hypothetical protein